MRQPEAQTAGWAAAHMVPEGRAALRDKGDSWKADEERPRQLRHPCRRYHGCWNQHQHLGPGPCTSQTVGSPA